MGILENGAEVRLLFDKNNGLAAGSGDDETSTLF
jgi:hypothetical protein